MRFKQRLKVIQSLEDTAKRSVVWMDPGSRGPRARAGAGVGMGPKWTASAEPPQTALRSGVQGPQHCPGWDWDAEVEVQIWECGERAGHCFLLQIGHREASLLP